MKRFSWPLQRLLDVTRQRELATQSQLGLINAQIQRLGQALSRRRRMLQDLLEQLSHEGIQQRIVQQAAWMACSPGQDRRIKQILQDLDQLKAKRQQALERLAEIRKSRMSYEKIREKAHEKWKQQVGRLEQQQLDEAAAIRFVLHPAGSSL